MSMFDIFGEGHDRFGFPEGIKRVTAGHGGEAILICGSEKTALLDCGMAYCGDLLVKNLRQALEGRSLDYILLSHSHYDHIGALPYVKGAFPKALVCGAAKARSVLGRPGARRLMKDLGENARDKYEPGSRVEITTEGMEVEQVIKEGDRICLGKEEFRVLETGGHTDCSLTFVLEPLGMMFASESTGILEKIDYVHTPILKSYEDAMKSYDKCRSYGAKYLVLPHFGLLPEDYNQTYWDFFQKEVENKRKYLRSLRDEGLTEEEILDRYAEKYWDPIKEQEQPYEAFMINSENIVKVLLASLDEK